MRIKLHFFEIIKIFIEYIFVFLVVLSTRSVYAQARDVDYYIPELCTGICLLLFLVKIYQHHGVVSLDLKSIGILVLYYIVILLYASISVSIEGLSAYASRFIIGIPTMVMLFRIYNQEGDKFVLLYKIVDVMVILSIISISLRILGSVFNVISPNEIFYTAWGFNPMQKSYFGVYFEQQRESFFFYQGYRNDGIFVEAPMHALCLIVAISIELFICRNNKNKSKNESNIKMAILMVAMLTTFSSTGIILLLIAIVMYLMVSLPSNKKYFAPYALFFFVSVMVILIAAYKIFITKSANTVSWTSRLDGYRVGYAAWLKAPIFGNGFREGNKYVSLLSMRTGFLNSIAAVLAQGGILLSSVYWIPIFGVIGKSLIDKNRNMTFLAIMTFGEFVLFTWEYTFLLLLLLSFFIAWRSQKGTIIEIG